MINPWRWLNTKLDQQTERSLAYEALLVREGHDQERRVWRGAAVRFVIGIAALLGYGLLPPQVSWLCGAVLGIAVGDACMARASRALAYRRGWLDGRLRFVQQAQHHQQQGNHPNEWFRTELDHDSVHVMGLPPVQVRREG